MAKFTVRPKFTYNFVARDKEPDSLVATEKERKGSRAGSLISTIPSIVSNAIGQLGKVGNLVSSISQIQLSSTAECGWIAQTAANIPQVSLSSTAGMNALLRDEFYTDRAAGQINGTSAEPGPGTRIVTDTEGKAYITNGKLYLTPKSTPSYGDPGVWYPTITRTSGRALIYKATRLSSGREGINVYQFGFDTNISSSPTFFFYPYTTYLLVRTKSGVVFRIINGFALDKTCTFALVLRTAGQFWFVKEEGQNWKLLYVDHNNTNNTLYPALTNYDSTTEVEFARVIDLPSPFNNDDGFLTQRLSGTRSAGDSFNHEANCLLEYTVNTLSSSGSIQVAFRRQDDNNCWRLDINSNGSMNLYEVVNGVSTSRGSAVAGTVANGHRISILMNGTYLSLGNDDAFRFYSPASNFATQINGKLLSVGTGGIVSDIATWKQDLNTDEIAILDRYSVG